MLTIKKILFHTKSLSLLIKMVKHCKKHTFFQRHALYLTPFGIRYDGRLMKSVDALLKSGMHVEILKPCDIQQDDIESWHPNLKITPIGLSGSYSYFPYIYDWQVAKYIKQSHAKHIVCRDLFTGVMGIKAGHAAGKKVIVDFYEWYSETKDYDFKKQNTMQKPFWKKKLFQSYEKYICKHADNLITNNQSFAHGIAQDTIDINKFSIIRNMPASKAPRLDELKTLKKYIPHVLQNHKILYYVGQLSFDRKLETLLEGMKNLQGFVLVIQGSGHEEMHQLYSHLLNSEDIKNRIIFVPPVHHSEIITYAQTADIGVFICDTADKKMFNALPNKLFEYVWAGIPQVSCEGNEISPIFKVYNIGETFDAYDPQSFVRSVISVASREKYSAYKSQVLAYRDKLTKNNDWDHFTRAVLQEAPQASEPMPGVGQT